MRKLEFWWLIWLMSIPVGISSWIKALGFRAGFNSWRRPAFTVMVEAMQNKSKRNSPIQI
jgi:hypothetical protein